MRALLRSGWDEPRPPRPPARRWPDWALASVPVAGALVEGALRPGLSWRLVSVLVVLGLAPTLLWRRSRPLLMIVIAFGILAVTPVLTGGAAPALQATAFVLVLPYALLRWGSGREIGIGTAVMLGCVGVCLAAQRAGRGDVISAAAVLFAALALGAAVRYRARARARELDQVALLERERLARDLHDTVAHHVSAIAIRAQAGLATAAAQPAAAAGAATEALRVIEAEASRTLAEMRAMVRVLRRGEPADRAPQPCIADLEQLAGRGRDGPAVDVQLAGDLADVPPPVGAAIYRLAQESVTNARRHARHATRIEVRVAADDRSVRLLVSDDGDTAPVRPAAAGFGLLGMIERAHLLGGTCEAGPAPGRGWTVTAVLPRTGLAT